MLVDYRSPSLLILIGPFIGFSIFAKLALYGAIFLQLNDMCGAIVVLFSYINVVPTLC